jgi:hypothetical protein
MTQRFTPTAPQHPVRQEDLPSRGAVAPPARHSKESAIIRRATLRRQRGSVERATAWIVLSLSVLGTIATLAGGWTPLIEGVVSRAPQWSAIVGGLALQIVLTFLEWYYFDTPIIAWPARTFDTITTMLGYGPLFSAPLLAFLIARGAPMAIYVAWAIIGLVSLAVAWYPESRLVD